MNMKKNIFILFILSSVFSLVKAQENTKFTVEVSSDSVLLGNFLQVKFTLENARGEQFSAPTFEGFNLISGPNLASSYSMINGETTQSASYTFYLEPIDIGNYYIEPASVNVEGEILETSPIEVLVVPNPDGIKQELRPLDDPLKFRLDNFGISPRLEDMDKNKSKKKKKKRYKI